MTSRGPAVRRLLRSIRNLCSSVRRNTPTPLRNALAGASDWLADLRQESSAPAQRRKSSLRLNDGFGQLETLECRIALTTEGTEIVVNSPLAGDQHDSSTAIAGNGSFVVVWEGPLDGSTAIFARRFNPTGDALAAQFVVADPTGGTAAFTDPKVAADLQGNFVVTYVRTDGGDDSVLAQRYDPDGLLVGSEFEVDTSAGAANDNNPNIGMALNGAFVIAWERIVGGDADIYARLYPAGGGAPGAPFQVDAGVAATQQTNPATAIDDSGNFIVAWQADDADPGNVTNIYKREFGTAPDATQQIVSASAVQNQVTPAVAIDDNLTYVVAWSQNSEIHYQQYLIGDFIFVADKLANPLGTGAETAPHISATSALFGQVPIFVATWLDFDGANYRIQALVVSSFGTPLAGPFTISTSLPGVKQNDSVSMAADGRFVASWTSNQKGDNDIIASRFSVPFIVNAFGAGLAIPLGSGSSIVDGATPANASTPRNFFRVTAGADGIMRVRLNSPEQLSLNITDQLFQPFVSQQGTNAASVNFRSEYTMPVVAGEDYYLAVFYNPTVGFDLQIDTTAVPTPARPRVNPSVSSPSPNTDFLTRHVRPDILVEVNLADFFAAGIPLLTPAQARELVPSTSGVAVAVYITDLRTGIVQTHYAVPASNPAGKFFKFTPTSNLADGTYSIAAAVEVIDEKPVKARGIGDLSEKTVLTVADIDPVLYVRQLYRTILQREAGGGEEQGHVNAIRSGSETYRSIEMEIWNSQEHRAMQVRDAYRSFLGRDADAGGLDIYRNALTGVRAAGSDQLAGAALSEEMLAQILLASTEYLGRFGGDQSAFVRDLYRTVLRRESDAGGQAGWEAQLNGVLNQQQVIAKFLGSVEYNNLAVDDYYRQHLGRGADTVGRNIYRSKLVDGTLSQRVLALELLSSEELYGRF